MTIRIIAPLLLSVLPFCVLAQASGEVERAKGRLFECYANSMLELDDGATDVSIVAGAVVSNCSAEFQSMIYMSAAGNRRVDIGELSRRVRAGHIEMIIPRILKLRVAAP